MSVYCKVCGGKLYEDSMPDAHPCCVESSLAPVSGSAIPVAVVFYDPEAPEGCEMSVALTKLSVAFLATLTDFELKVVAAEAGLRVRRAFEMPPSPND